MRERRMPASDLGDDQAALRRGAAAIRPARLWAWAMAASARPIEGGAFPRIGQSGQVDGDQGRGGGQGRGAALVAPRGEAAPVAA